MTTTTRSHKLWTDKGGHVNLTIQQRQFYEHILLVSRSNILVRLPNSKIPCLQLVTVEKSAVIV